MLILIIALLLLSLGVVTYLYCDIVKKYTELIAKIPEYEEKARKDALTVSRRVIKGQVSEQVAPFLPGFPYKSTDLKFFGNCFDFVAIVGMAEARDTSAQVDEIVFIDIKRNTSQLSVIQRKIKDAIVEGRVAWETMQVDEQTNEITVHRAKSKGPKA